MDSDNTDKFFNENLFDDSNNDNVVIKEEDVDDVEEVVDVTSFDELGLKDKLLRGLYGYGFEKPSKIQCRAVPMVLTRCDVIAQSQSGTGKTGAFSISALQLVDESLVLHTSYHAKP